MAPDAVTIRAVLFDWDGTLVDSLDLVRAAHNHVRTHYGLAPWTAEDAKANIRLSSREIYPVWFGDKAGEAIILLYDYYTRHSAQNVRLMPGLRAFLDGLIATGIPLGVVSNRRHDNLVQEIQTLGLQSYFQAIIGAGYAPRDKPAPDPLWAALNQMNIPSEYSKNVIYVGDTPVDVECAQAAGAISVFIEHGSAARAEVEPLSPSNYVKDLAALGPLLLEKLNQTH